MARWLVQLKGDLPDLQEISYCFPDGNIYVLSEHEQVYLAGQEFEMYDEASYVRDAALKALDEMSGVISLLWSGFQKPTVDKIIRERDDGSLETTLFVPSAYLRIKTGHLTVNGVKGRSEAQQLLDASRRNRHLNAAVSVWGDPPRTWSRLYHTLDEIEKALGKSSVVKARFCTKPELDRFTQTANSAEAVGKDARHGLNRVKPNPNPMSLQEAIRFIGRLLEQALSSTLHD
jgi:hypothetical protein